MSCQESRQPAREKDCIPWYDRRADLICPLARQDLIVQHLDDEAVLFDPCTGSTFRLNRTAIYVWQHCKPGYRIQDIVQAIFNKYDADFDKVLDDVEQAIAFFAENGLILPADQSMVHDTFHG